MIWLGAFNYVIPTPNPNGPLPFRRGLAPPTRMGWFRAHLNSVAHGQVGERELQPDFPYGGFLKRGYLQIIHCNKIFHWIFHWKPC